MLLPFYTRALTTDAYGDYSLAIALVALGPALVLGLPSALSKQYFDVKDPAAAFERYGSVARLQVTVTAIVAIVLELGVLAIAPAQVGLFGKYGLSLVNIAIAGSTLLQVPIQVGRDMQRPLLATAFQMAEFVTTLACGLVYVQVLHRHLEGALEALATAYALLGLGTCAFIILAMPGKLALSQPKVVFGFSIPYIPHFLAVWLQGVAERWALKAVDQTASLGLYAIAAQITSPISLVVASWNLERSARSGELFRKEGPIALSRASRAITRDYLVAAVVPSVLVLVGLPFVPWILGSRFAPAIYMVPFLICPLILEAIYNPANHIAYYMGRSGKISLVTTAAALTAVAVSASLVPTFGVKGAIVSRIASALVRTLAMWFVARSCVRSVAVTSS